jgi:dipeptidyl aminopeptidase/acylaminoacyl peptidase
VGCGLREGGEALLEEGLRRVGDAYAWADPRPHLARVRPPVAIVHGRDDDVIPYFEAYKMRAALPKDHPHEMHLTGMYGHTGSSLPSPSKVFAEIKTLLRVVRILAQAPILT